jgi:hypothetical protein
MVPNLNISRTINMMQNRKPWDQAAPQMVNDMNALQEAIQKLQAKVFGDPPAAPDPPAPVPVIAPDPPTTVNGIKGSINIVGSRVSSQPGTKNIVVQPNAGMVNPQVADYAPAMSDSGKHIPYNSATPGTYTLPNPAPPDGWWVAVQCVGAGALTVDPNGLMLDTSASTLVHNQGQGSLIFSDGSNFWSMRGIS